MNIRLNPETEERLIGSIQRYFEVNMSAGIGYLKAKLLLDFCVKEFGLSIYNQAILDAQSAMQDKVADLDVSCYEAEIAYWSKK